jgi:hypothetical protein
MSLSQRYKHRQAHARVEMLEQRMLLTAVLFVSNDGNGTVSEYTASGAVVAPSLVPASGDLLGGVALSGTDLFVADTFKGTIGEYTASGAVVNASLITGLDEPQGIAISGSDIFVANFESGTIGEYTTSGATINASLISGLQFPLGLAVSGSDLFVTLYGNGPIGEYTTSGATVNASLISGLNYKPWDIAISGSDMFVTGIDNGTVSEYTTYGETISAPLISGLTNPQGILVSGSDLYVANSGTTIGQYTTSGATVNASLVSGLESPNGVALTNLDVPAAPEVTATQGTAPHHVALTWAAVSGASSYQVFRSTVDNFAVANKISGGVTADFFNDTTASPGVVHYYWVRARNSIGFGPASAAATGYIPLQAPVVSVTDEPHHVTLTWAAVTNATSYQVWRSTNDNVADATRIGNNVTSDFFNDTTADLSTTYFYFVRAKNTATGVGLWSTGEIGELS